MAHELEPALSGLRELLAPLAQAIGRGWVRWDTAENLLEQGWVPNFATPYDLVAECGDDGARLQTSLLDYYTDNWVEVRTQLESRLSSYGIDDEAKATFREALGVHAAGFYPAVSRLLFELVRVGGQDCDGPWVQQAPIGSRPSGQLAAVRVASGR